MKQHVDVMIFLAAFVGLVVVWNWTKREALESNPWEMTLKHQGKVERLIALIQQVDVTPDMIDEFQNVIDTHRQNISDIETNLASESAINRPDAYPIDPPTQDMSVS
jgi:hypothetical protein